MNPGVQRHRTETGRHYRGLTVHAAPGVHERAIQLVLEILPPRGNVVDIGAGSGAFALRLKEAGYEVLAVDTDTSSLPEGIPAVEVASSKGLSVVLGHRQFDVAIALEVIEHVDGPLSFIEEIWKILQPNGSLVLSTPNVLHPYSRLKFLLKGSYWLFGPEAYYSTGHVTPLPLWLLRLHLETAGFRDVRHGYGGTLELGGIRGTLAHVMRPFAKFHGGALGSRDDASTLLVVARKGSAEGCSGRP